MKNASLQQYHDKPLHLNPYYHLAPFPVLLHEHDEKISWAKKPIGRDPHLVGLSVQRWGADVYWGITLGGASSNVTSPLA